MVSTRKLASSFILIYDIHVHCLLYKRFVFYNAVDDMSKFSELCIKIQSTLVISKSKGPFEISVLRHIRFVVLRKKQFEQPIFTNDYVI